MGIALTRLLLAALVACALSGCGRMSSEAVREKDQERIETSKNMPGNDIPLDPADGR
ncbi:MAG: hypothetical protein M3R13_09720 [Armatimonadota bacterium]|nr:hypothetical protein [Armatimonadota bacterium]